MVHSALTEMAALASERGKQAELITNGTLLTRRKAAELPQAGVSRIWVSIDELYENYGKIQVGSDFGLVPGNLEAFNELRQGTEVRLGMTSVVMRDNIASLRRIREFSERFGADEYHSQSRGEYRAGALAHLRRLHLGPGLCRVSVTPPFDVK